MTLTIARKRERYAVLASDGLWSKGPSDEAKIACHPSLPIACTVSGLLTLPLPAADPFRKKNPISGDIAPTTAYIRDALESITSIDHLTTETIGELLAGKLAPFVNEAYGIACHVAMVKNEKSDVGFMVIGMKSQWPPNPVDHGAWGWWADGVRQGCGLNLLSGLFDGEIAQADTSPPQTPDELAAIMTTIVNEAIAQDAKRPTGRSIGGTAHVAKVTRHSAFLI